IVTITWSIRGFYGSILMSFHQAAFQVGSIITTTGYSTVDFDQWPQYSRSLLVLIMFCGACAGSTGGGIKRSRVLLLIKSAIRDLRLSMHPKKVQTIRLDGRSVSERTVSGVTMYLTIYCFIVIVSFLLVSLDGFSVESNFSAVMACFNNIGPGFDAVGPLSNFAGFSPFSKLILCFDMLAGRLEIYPIMILLMKRTWADSKRKV
ncbi:MAG: TrkH family potassium uptake protein, partial [Oscillospiraceae bacterium]|nr:TrkH family potassium uptake protein [Oscillospiraceae bacterium]